MSVPIERFTVGVGDWVEFPIGTNKFVLVVDIDPENILVPPPSLTIAYKVNNKIKEGVVQLCYVRKVRR
jgi:hypothetical protein